MSNKIEISNSTNIVNIESEETDDNIVVSNKDGYYDLRYYKKAEDFMAGSNFTNFIKSVERIVRQSNEYSAYKSYLVNELHLDHCMVMSKIDIEKADIEMHHGPILTLFDYCAIVTDHMVANDQKVSSFIVAKKVLEEHFEHNVQVVMLSKTAHQLAHSNGLFIHPKQAWGDLNAFLDRYIDGVSEEQMRGINQYIDMANDLDGTEESGKLEMSAVSDWNKRREETLEVEDIE